MRVAVTIAPLLSAARELAPVDAALLLVTPIGVSPHVYEPSPGAIAGLLDADVVVRVGHDLSPVAARALARHPRDGRRDVVMAKLADGSDEAGAHEMEPHLWLDPASMRRLIPALRDAIEQTQRELGALDDAELARLDAAESKLLAQIDETQRAYTSALEPFAGSTVAAQRSAFSAVAAWCGLRVAAVLAPAHGAEPTPGAMVRVVKAASDRGAAIMLAEPGAGGATGRRAAALAGIPTAVFDPIGEGDWAAMMDANLRSIVKALTRSDALIKAGDG